MLQVGGGLDLLEEPLGADHRGEVRMEHLDGDLAVVFEVVRQPDRGHAAGAELALDAIAAGEGGGETSRGVSQGAVMRRVHRASVETSTDVIRRASRRNGEWWEPHGIAANAETG